MIKSNIVLNKDNKIRRLWDEENKKWYFSIVDIVGLLTNSSDSRNYWKVLKNRLKNSNSELVTNCNQLKMTANDGKSYMTDTADEDTMLQIIDIISPSNIGQFKAWFSHIHFEKLANLEQDSNLKNNNFNSKISEFSTAISNDSDKDDFNENEAEIGADAYETPTHIIIQIMTAGTANENVSIDVTCNTLSIKGKRDNSSKINGDQYLHKELYWGRFYKKIYLPKDIEVDKSEAYESHGMLTIKLKKIDKSQTRKLKITSI